MIQKITHIKKENGDIINISDLSNRQVKIAYNDTNIASKDYIVVELMLQANDCKPKYSYWHIEKDDIDAIPESIFNHMMNMVLD